MNLNDFTTNDDLVRKAVDDTCTHEFRVITRTSRVSTLTALDTSLDF